MRLSVIAAIALVLTFSGGFVDAVGYLTVYHTFTSHMTGLTAHLGMQVVESHWWEALRLFAVLLSFVFGAIAGRWCIEIARRRGIRRSATLPLALEAMLMGAVCVFGSRGHVTADLANLLAAAMGLQTAVLTRVGSLTVHTTFVTGMLNKLAELLSNFVFLVWDEHRTSRHTAERAKVRVEALFMFWLWFFYAAGATTGAWMNSKWSFRALLLPAGILVATLLTDCVHPLGVAQEHRFPES